MQSPSRLHLAAREFAGRGIPIFPCVVGGKEPAVAEGFYAASSDLGQIDAWWGEADYNIGLCPEDAGWCVVDIDGARGEENWTAVLAQEGQDDTQTYTIRTPRGGRHLYFAGSLPPSTSKLAEKVDTRGRGSYVLVPPSVVGGIEYAPVGQNEIQEVPAFIVEAIQARVQATRAAEGTYLDQEPARERAKAFLRDAVQRNRVAIEGSGGDNLTYEIACHTLGLGLSIDVAFDLIREHWNPHCQPPWEDDELRTKIENAAQYSQNEPGAFAVNPAAETFASGIQALPITPEVRSRFYLEDTTEQDQHPIPTWLLEDVIAEKSTALLVGITGSYKTFIALDMALSTSTSRETFGKVPLGGPVVYATGEGRFSLRRRRTAWELAHGLTSPIPNFYLTATPRIAIPGEMQEFGDAIHERLAPLNQKPRLIVLDTAAKCMVGLNENDARDVNQFIEFCDSLVREFGCSVLALHHKSDKASAADIRGNSAFRAGFDTYLECRAFRDTMAVEVWARQHKDADERDHPWTFQGKRFGDSLWFAPTSREDHEALTKKDETVGREVVGAALRSLNAIGREAAVTTHVLASQLYQGSQSESIEARALGVSKVSRRLGSLGRTKLRAYCTQETSGLLWWLPAPASE